MVKEFPVIESMFKWTNPIDSTTVRVWRNEIEVKEEYDNRDLEKHCVLLMNGPGMKGRYKSEMARTLMRFEGVITVEVVDSKGRGILLYKEWP